MIFILLGFVFILFLFSIFNSSNKSNDYKSIINDNYVDDMELEEEEFLLLLLDEDEEEEMY